jgi:aspartate aminotransferase-like enzyme
MQSACESATALAEPTERARLSRALTVVAHPLSLCPRSVVYTDRALNHMSKPFITAMNDISETLKQVYNAKHAVVIPGSGTYGMEAVARQFATGKKTLVLRNGYFSYRWTQIFEACGIPTDHTVLRAEPVNPGAPTNEVQYAPHAIEKVVEHILQEKPAVVFAPHVETSTGMILPDEYISKVSEAVHSVGGLMVLDCIASGTVWVDMQKTGVDALISAPQKGWTGPSCAGLVMLSDRGADVTRASRGSSFVCDLRKWLELMDTYEQGGFMYHATMPTDALVTFRDVMMETKSFGFKLATENAWKVRGRPGGAAPRNHHSRARVSHGRPMGVPSHPLRLPFSPHPNPVPSRAARQHGAPDDVRGEGARLGERARLPGAGRRGRAHG